MSEYNPLSGPRKRIERADKHLNEIVSEVEAYAASHQNSFRIEHDRIRNQPNIIMTVREPLPDIVPLAVSDCIHNFRSALDHLIFELAWHDSGVSQNGTQFPICDDVLDFQRLAPRYLRGCTPAHIDAIEAYQPYKGINWTKTLRDISNPDKHREITIVRSRAETLIRDGVGEVFKGAGPDRTDVQMETKTTVAIAFRDGQPVIETLEIIKREVSLVIDSFSPEFKV
jgi:hypothetical protein